MRSGLLILPFFPSILLEIMHNYSIISGKNLSSFFGCRQGKMREKKKRGWNFTRGFLGTGGRGSAVFYSALQRAPVHIPPLFIRRYSECRYAYRRFLFGATASAGTHTAVFYSALQRAPVRIPPLFIRRYSERRYKKPRVFFSFSQSQELSLPNKLLRNP